MVERVRFTYCLYAHIFDGPFPSVYDLGYVGYSHLIILIGPLYIDANNIKSAKAYKHLEIEERMVIMISLVNGIAKNAVLTFTTQHMSHL